MLLLLLQKNKLFLLLLAFIYYVSFATSDCPPVIVEIPQQFLAYDIVLRLNLMTPVTTTDVTPCSYNISNDDATGPYEFETQITQYTVLEVFKGDDLSAGDTIAMLFGTGNTGHQLLPPTRITYDADDEGFLAFLTPIMNCFDLTNSSVVAQQPVVYSMSECLDNGPWSNVAEVDKSILRGEVQPPVATLPNTGDSADNTPTMSPSQKSTVSQASDDVVTYVWVFCLMSAFVCSMVGLICTI